MDKEKAINICKMGQGHDCCRYLGAGMKGLECLKLTELKHFLDNRVLEGTINARGDNCEGEKQNDSWF